MIKLKGMKAAKLLVLLCLCQLTGMSQKMDPKAVPKPVQEVFIKDFPGVMAAWEQSNGHYVASFDHNEYHMQTVYNSSGDRLETHVNIDAKELPAMVQDYVSKHNSATVTEATKIITEQNKVSFRVLAGNQYMEFDSKGNYLHSRNK